MNSRIRVSPTTYSSNRPGEPTVNTTSALPKPLVDWPAHCSVLALMMHPLVGICVLGLVIALLYQSAWGWLFETWWSVPEYSHGFLVPLVSLYLVWIRREQLVQLDPRARPMAGGLVLLTSGLFLLAGKAGGWLLPQAVSLLVLLPGIVLFVWGWNHLKALALPLAYLQFMVPWMDEFFEQIHWPFQLLSASIGISILQSLGIPVLHEGKYILLPTITLEVARECSGVRFLTSVIALGIPLVYLTQRTWWRASSVIVFGVVITILTNGARVALAGMMAYSYGPAMLHGPLKIFQGWFVAQVGFIFLFLVNWAVCKLPARSTLRLHERWKVVINEDSPFTKKTGSTGQFALVLLFLIGLALYTNLLEIPRATPLRRPLNEFPSTAGDWYWSGSNWFNGKHFFPGADTELIRTYRTRSGREVRLYVGYFASQRQGKSLINYRANPLREGLREVRSDFSDLGPQYVNQSFPMIDNTRYAALYWYRLATTETTGRYETKFRQVFDALVRWRNNGAVIIIAAPATRESPDTSPAEDLFAFARVVGPLLRDFVP